ncbi:MAG TPA: lmo0937 family membrane protein [Terracidiphilus sp.]
MAASKRVLLIQARTVALGRLEMLWTIFVILLVLWLVGLVSSYTLGGFIHLLLVAAVVVLILQLISGRRPVV